MLYGLQRQVRQCDWLYSLFFISQYILACVLLPAEALSMLVKADQVSEYPFW